MKPLNSQKIQSKLRNKFLKEGVKMLGAETIFFSRDTKIGKNVLIEPYVVFGQAANVGAGTITCNYDCIKKHKTKIKDKVFIGSNSSLVAPVIINTESIVGAGSVITKNVSKNSLALTRALQTEIKNYERKK